MNVASLLLVVVLGGQDAMPDAAALRKAETRVRNLFGKTLNAAKPAEKPDVARRMIEAAAAEEPAVAYALLRRAREVAAESGDPEVLIEAVDATAARFAVPADFVEEALAAAAESPRGPVSARGAAEACLLKMDETAAADRYDEAMRYARAAYTAAGKARDEALLAEVLRRGKAVKALQAENAAVVAGLRRLAAEPDDAELNARCGRFLALVKADWPRALPMLARGSDAELKAAAEKDLKNPDSAALQAEVGNAWWEIGQKLDDPMKRHALARAATWYRKGQAGLTGLEKSRVTYRLAEIKGFGRGGGPKEPPPASPAGSFDARRGAWADLLPAILPAKDAVAGSWRIRDKQLELSAEKGAGRLVVPLAPLGDFDLEVVFTRLSEGTLVGAIVPVGKRQCLVALNYLGQFNGLDTVDGSRVTNNATTAPGALNSGRTYKLEIGVRVDGTEASVTAQLDGRPWIFYRGEAAALGLHEEWKLPDAEVIGLAAQGNAVFHSLRFRRLSGEARPRR